MFISSFSVRRLIGSFHKFVAPYDVKNKKCNFKQIIFIHFQIVLREGRYTRNSLLKLMGLELSNAYSVREARSISLLVLEKFLKLSSLQILSKIEFKITESTEKQINRSLKRLKKHEPIQYVLKRAWFYHRYYKVNKHVFIPRPETEELVDHLIREHQSQIRLNILDIGTGSACIAVSLCLFLNKSFIFALDKSLEAIKIAEKNAKIYNAKNIRFLKKDILNDSLDSLPKLDIIISNPPYVTKSDIALMHKNVLNFEPLSAWSVPEKDTFAFYKRICSISKKKLVSGGKIYIEINEKFSEEIMSIFLKAGFSKIKIIQDLCCKDRIITASIN